MQAMAARAQNFLSCLVSVCTLGPTHALLSRGRKVDASMEENGAYRQGGRGEESARAVCASRKNDFTRGASSCGRYTKDRTGARGSRRSTSPRRARIGGRRT